MARWITSYEIKKRFNIDIARIYQWHCRHPGDIRRTMCKGTALYWSPDVLRYLDSQV